MYEWTSLTPSHVNSLSSRRKARTMAPIHGQSGSSRHECVCMTGISSNSFIVQLFTVFLIAKCHDTPVLTKSVTFPSMPLSSSPAHCISIMPETSVCLVDMDLTHLSAAPSSPFQTHISPISSAPRLALLLLGLVCVGYSSSWWGRRG